MKKFLVSILGIFLLFGAALLTACGGSNPSLKLSQDTVAIQLYAEDEDSGYQIVTAELSGVDSGKIQASALSGYENVVKVSTSTLSSTKCSIRIEGLEEGTAQVVVRATPGNIEKRINVTVFSEVSAMSQVVENDKKKNNFLIRGEANSLIEEKLISFQPSSNSRRTLTWAIAEEMNMAGGLTLDGTTLTVEDTFVGNEVILDATTEKGVSTKITLPVVDKIESEVKLAFSYSQNSSFDEINEENNIFNIVPNIPTDECYTGYILVDYIGDLEITPYVIESATGKTSDDIQVMIQGNYEGKPLYAVYASKDKPDINKDYEIGFKIGYENFNYFIDTAKDFPITIKARELVNGITISTNEANNIAGSVQTLYTNYVDSASASINGQKFDISITPTTVIDATKKYSIDVERLSGGGIVADGCPIEAYYKDELNGNVWTQVIFTLDGNGHYVTREEDYPSAATLYLKASSSLKEQVVEGFRITFVSQDNTDISTSFNLRLVKSASLSEFAFNDAGFRIDSSVLYKEYKKTFTLKGQTSIDGLYIINNSKNVIFDDITEVSHDEESVTFSVSLNLKTTSYGQTSLDSYQIAHRNGLISDSYDLDIFLPLKYGSMFIDTTTENRSNSVIDSALSNKVYTTAGTETASSPVGSLSRLILKNNTTTPLFYTYNTINGISAVANIGVSFYDFDSENDDIDRFKGLINTADGILNIIRGATERGDTSNVAYFSSDRTSISTKSVGHTYAVISFTGKGVEGTDANGQVTYVRIIYIESFVTPEALSVNPESDKNVSLYAFDTLATSDEALTRKTINIRFKNSNVTYNSLDYNLEFVSTNGAMGDMKVSGDTVTWSNGCYSISGIKITEEGITFTIEALSISKYEDTIFTDSLNVHYVIRDGKSDTSKKIYDIYTPIDIVIKNAQRIENLKWKNYDDEGLYFEVGDDQPQYLLLETGPNSARNKSVAYIITDQNNSTNSKFVSVSDAVSSNILSINLANSIKNGMTGYIYILPADAIYNNQIRYYYMDGDKEKSGSISDTDLPSQYEYLVSNAYFKSNAFDGTTKTVKFSDILVKIKVTVADGKSFEYAFRIYDNNAFKNMRPELYYTVMNNLDLSGEERSAITSFSGGLQGANKDITVRLSGANFAGTIAAGGQVRNITFVGDITTGNGFVANVNNGKLSNITIDVNGLKPSSITASGIVGGLVGENNGEIDGCRVLGLNIFGGTDYVGGIAGKNLNKISNSKVEFYNLENSLDPDNKVTYASNKFRGGVVGGVVGYMSASASIDHSYAYDYTIAPNSSAVLISNLQEGGKLGQLVGDVETADGKRATIDYSFAVLSGGIGTLCNNENITITNSYYAYYSGSSYITDATMQTENSNFVSASDNDPAYKAYVNKGNPHLRDLVQDEPVSSVNSLNIKTSSANGYYKSLEVKSTDSVSRGVLFNYSLKDGAVELNASEQNGLNQLNTITLSELLGTSVSANVIVSSSNSNIVKVLGSSLQIVGCGDTTIRLSSKQDVTNNKVISIKVVYALSDLMISWTDSAGRVTYVQEASQLTLQRTHSRYYGVNFENSQVFLGNLATAYELKQNENASLNILVDKVDITNDKGEVINQDNEKVIVGEGDISISGFKVLTNSNSTLSKFRVSPSIFDETVFQNAVNDAFTRNFFINAIDGVISFDISGESIPLTPSTTANIEVRIKTTMLNDKVYPIISLNGLELDRKEGEGKNTNLYTIKGQDEAILEVTSTLTKIEESQKATSGDLNTYTYNVVFAVNPAYREMVSQDMDFDVYMMSDSGNSSKDWKGEFKLHLTRQNFTNIDVSNRKISSSIFKNINGTIVEEHTASEPVSVLAPGKSSILQINVNPKFAYYDHVDLVYSNATVSDALNIEVVKETGNDTFVRRVSENGDIEPVGSGLRFYPKAAEKGSLYYKLWVNTTVNRDSTIKLTAYFYDNSSETPITYVNYYISISYLTEPTIKVDGATTAYVARGSYATIQIDVLADQSIDSLLLADDDGRDGVIITQPSKPVIDKDKGIKTYTANMYASVLAKATNDTVYLTAQVSRELNGSKEFKTSVATVVLVDFKLQENSIVVDEKPEGNVVIWQGVNKPITFDYDLLPEDYGAASNPELEKAIADLRAKRDLFLGAQYYPARLEENDEGRNYLPLGKNKDYNNGNEIVGNNNEKLEDYKYFINYKYDENNELKVQTIEDRLYFVSGYDRIPISDDAVEKPFDYKFDPTSNSIVLTGIRIASAVQMVLKTYISAGGITREIETPFTVSVEAYSDPDLPLLIKSAKDFKNLNPNKSSEGTTPTPQDYILTKDILLEDYTAFDTSLIRSLDGNGYTIHIRSFNMPENTSTLNLALFDHVSEETILKNVRVNIYNGGQITVNTFKYSEVNVAGFAIENAGIITNCEVVSYYTTNSAVGDIEELNYPACVKHNYPSGINVTYTRGENTEPDYIVDNADWSTQISGFVISNQGSITNSRVGGDSITVLGDEKMIDGQASGRTYASKQELDTFYMIGQGNMTGFVGNNSSGNISACFVKKLDMENQSKTTQYYAAGFVGVNSSTINVSYIEGVPTDPAVIQADPNNYSVYAYEGSSIKSKMGYVVGFVYKNDVNGKINDSYSNILISNTNDSNSVYLASGYVYENEGKIENGYSASQIRNQMNTQMNFSGVNRSGELLAKGEYINCYFFNKQYNDIEDTTDDTTETQNNTGAVMIPEPDEESLFYGFAIANGENDGIWKIIEDKGIFLVSTDFISVSHRYIYRVDDNIFEGVAGEDDQGKYILPYSTLTFTDSSTEINTALGGEFNPIIIKDAEDFIAVSGTSTSSYIKEYFNSSALWGTYRLVDDINLGDIASGDNVIALPSSSKAFAGTFYGNGFTISGLSIATEQEGVGFGLFKSIEKRGRGSNPVVKNLNINVTQVDGSVVTMSGALAGYIKDAVIISIDIKFAENAQVTGLNFAGGLAGFVFGDNTIKCIRIENPNVKATKSLRDDEGTSNYFISKPEGSDPRALQTLRTRVSNNLNYNTSVDASIIQDTLANYSYAGGMFGFADIFKTNNNAFDINQSKNYAIKNVRVFGEVYIEGQVAGGVFGLAGYQTNVRDIGLTITGGTNSHILATKYFAGGIVGQSFGTLTRVFAVHDDETQDKIENNMGNFYNGNEGVERGSLDLFSMPGTNYTQKYVGGLIGVAFSGNLEISYSKLNVTAPNASYAGGVIGGLELNDASAYQLDVEGGGDSYYSTYFINEVYATGDIRADVFAGGIIGRVVGQSARVGMQSVNAFNYFTTYDYSTGEYAEIEDGTKNFSELFKVNSLVGMFANVNEDGTVNDVIVSYSDNTDNKPAYNNYLTLIKYIGLGGGDNSGSGETEAVKPVASVAYYEGYYKNNQTNDFITLKLFGDITGNEKYPLKDNSGNIVRDENGNIVYGDYKIYDNLVYSIESPSSFTNSSAGYQYTSTGFLNSGAWNVINWEHDVNDLFPTIKYKRSSSIIYLDAYDASIEKVFNTISGNNHTVYIRGLASEGSENYIDIDLRSFYAKPGNDSVKIRKFAGRLKGGMYPETGKKVRIITDRNFIESVTMGFSAIDVEVVYLPTKENDNYIEVYSQSADDNLGLFINSPVEGVTITGLQLEIKKPINFYVGGVQAANVGIIAPTIANSTISNIKIFNESKSNGTLMNIAKKDQNISRDAGVEGISLNAGLVSGEISHNSTNTSSTLEKVDIRWYGDLISVVNNGFQSITDYYLGGYTGIVYSEGGEKTLTFELDDLKKLSDVASTNATADITHISLSGTSPVNNVYMGGYIGKMGKGGFTSLDKISITQKKSIFVAFNVNTNVANDLAVGSIVGNLGASRSNMTLDMATSNVKSYLFVNKDFSVGNLYAGGIVGKLGPAFGVTNVESINFSVTSGTNSGDNYLLSSEKEKLTGVYKLDKNNQDISNSLINVNKHSYVGGVVGYAQGGTLSVGGEISINKLTTEKEVNSFRIKYTGTEQITETDAVNIGSILGYTEGSIKISGDIKSDTEIYVDSSNATRMNVGGFVGCINKGGVNEIASGSQMAQFDGAVYSNSKNLIFGGIVAKFNAIAGDHKNGLSIVNTSFGGVAKVYGANSLEASIIAGGTVGEVATTTDSQDVTSGNDAIKNLVMASNINYGDVFVEYDQTFFKLNSYTFGGLVGKFGANESNELDFQIDSNYSLTTTHNAKYSTTTGTANALFGDGITTTTTSSNYYNHAVALANDECGIDIGYNYSNGYRGYNWQGNDTEISHLLLSTGKISDNKAVGQKLNPAVYETNTQMKKVETFNGMSYYVVEGGVFNGSSDGQIRLEDSETNNLKNIAIIGGSSQEIKYEGNKAKISSIIDTLSGHSFVSGMVLDVSVDYELTEDDDNDIVAPLVKEMQENSTLYAINVKGTFDVGGNTSPIVSGLVGVLKSGRIFDCSTDLDIIYRAGKNTSNGVFGIVRIEDTENNKLIENTYASGSITSYITTNVYAFANSQDYSYVRNCYAIGKLDLMDYTNASNEMDTNAIVDVFGYGATANIEGWRREYLNCYFDYDALNYWSARFTNDEIPKAKTGSVNAGEYIKPLKYSDLTKIVNDKWVSDKSYNYGYPTLKYQYLKPSSFAYHDNSVKTENGKTTKASMTKLERLLNEGQTFETYDKQDINLNTAFENGNLKNFELYDKYIQENKYVRLPNGYAPQTTYKNSEGNDEDKFNYLGFDCFYMIPNAAILTNRQTIYQEFNKHEDADDKFTTNFILKYDIDLEKVVDNLTEDYNTQKEDETDFEFEGKFDGQNKTINFIKQTLFTKVYDENKELNDNNAFIINLRLTNIELQHTPAIALEIKNAKLSNIFLSGNLNIGFNISKFGALAQTIIGSELSVINNIAEISGIVQSKTLAAGGLAGIIKDSKLKYCSNYGPINARTKDSNETDNNGTVLALGGLVGVMYGESEISYSYNATSVLGNYASGSQVSTAKGKFFTGGLVGYMHGGNIVNSYNSGMIKSGNKNNVGSSNNTKYNFGVSETDTCFGEQQKTIGNHAAYAGGIIGYAANGVVNGCYNEGTVEALGKNPDHKWYWDGSYWREESSYLKDDNRKMNQTSNGKIGKKPIIETDYKLVLKQVSNRNVYSYGIGTQKKDTIITESSIKLSKGNYNDTSTIYSNGSALENNAVIYSKDLEEILETLNSQGFVEEVYNLFTKNYYFAFHWWGIPWWDHYYTFNCFEYSIKLLAPKKGKIQEFGHVGNQEIADSAEEGQTTRIKTLSTNELNIPLSYIIEFSSNYNLNFKYEVVRDRYDQDFGTDGDDVQVYWNDKGGEYNKISVASDTKAKTIKTGYNDLVASVMSNGGDIYYNLVYSGNNKNDKSNYVDKYKISNIVGSSNVIKENNNDLKEKTRSLEDGNENADTITINNKSYYLANRNNMTKIFSAGIYSKNETLKYLSEGEDSLPFINNIDYYNIKVESVNGKAGVNAKIKNIYQTIEGDKKYTCVNYDIFSVNKIEGDYKTTVTLDYKEDFKIDLDNLKYYWTDYTSFGVYIPDFSYRELEDYSVYYNGQFIDNVIRLSKKKYDVTNEPSDGDDNFIYLFYKDEDKLNGDIQSSSGIFTYVPNLTLYNSKGDEFLVNVQNDFKNPNSQNTANKQDEGKRFENQESFAEDVKILIDRFTKTNIYYSRSVKIGGTPRYISLNNDKSFTEYRYVDATYTASETTTVDKNLNYGKAISNVASVDSFSNGGYLVTLNINQNYQEMIGLENNKVLFGFNRSKTGINRLAFSSNRIIIKGNSYDIEVKSENSFLMKSIHSDSQSTIQEYMNNDISFIVNDFDQKFILSDQFKNISENTIIYLKDINGKVSTEDYITLSRELEKVWKYNNEILGTSSLNKNGIIFTRIGNDIQIEIDSNANNLVSYTFNGAVVYKGELTISLSETYTSNFPNVNESRHGVTFHNKQSEQLYYDFKMIKDGANTIAYSGMTAAMTHFQPLSGQITGEYRILASYKSGYLTKSNNIDETYEYNLLLKDKNQKYHYINVEYLPSTSTSDASLTLKSIQREYSDKKGNYTLIEVEDIETVDTTEDGQETTVREKTYYIDGNPIYKVKYDLSSKKYTYVVYYDEKGNLLYTKDTDDEGEEIQIPGQQVVEAEEIYFLGNPSGLTKNVQKLSEYIGKTTSGKINLNNLPKVNDYRDLIGERKIPKTIGTIKDPITGENISLTKSASYLYIKGDYNVEKSLEREYKGFDYSKAEKETILETNVRVYEVEYSQFKVPSYNVIKETFSYKGMDLEGNIKSKNLFSKAEGSMEIYLRDKEDLSILNLIAKLVGTGEQKIDNVSINDADAARDIILTEDISFIDNINAKSDKYNIIGNGYSISYYNGAFFDELVRSEVEDSEPEFSFISNINFLGQIYGTQAFINTKATSGDNLKDNYLYKVSAYGSAVNIQRTDQTSILINGKCKVDSFNNYVAINALSGYTDEENGEKYYKVYLMREVDTFNEKSADNQNNILNFGVIVTASGKSGQSQKTSNGEKGQTAVSISASDKIKISNNGLIVLGKGGNGGAGGKKSFSGVNFTNAYKGMVKGKNGISENFAGSTISIDVTQNDGDNGLIQRAKMIDYFGRSYLDLSSQNTNNRRVSTEPNPKGPITYKEGNERKSIDLDGSSENVNYCDKVQTFFNLYNYYIVI